jgi:HAD superfamily hydrolase (TIGR01509 family)
LLSPFFKPFVKAFIFDFDGVIVDSEYHWDKHSLSTYKSLVPAYDEEYDKQLKGRNMHDIYNMLVRDFGVTFSKEEYAEHLKQLTDKIYGELTELLPGIASLVERLHRMNIPTSIASSGEREWIQWALERLGMKDAFFPIVTAFDVGIGKPDPAVYVEAARQMHVSPTDCVALEDSTNGVLSAKAAGIYCIGLHHQEGYIQNLKQADKQIQSMDELSVEILRSL